MIYYIILAVAGILGFFCCRKKKHVAKEFSDLNKGKHFE
jgi:hypothetical protein